MQCKAMFQPTEFSDGHSIMIVNGVPYCYSNGATYKDKLINGIPLEYKFNMEDCRVTECEYVEESIEVEEEFDVNKKNRDAHMDSETNAEYYDRQEHIVCPTVRKGKYISTHKKQSRNTKKNAYRQLGYADKLFETNQHLTTEVEPEDEVYYEYKCWIDTGYDTDDYDDYDYYF